MGKIKPQSKPFPIESDWREKSETKIERIMKEITLFDVAVKTNTCGNTLSRALSNPEESGSISTDTRYGTAYCLGKTGAEPWS